MVSFLGLFEIVLLIVMIVVICLFLIFTIKRAWGLLMFRFGFDCLISRADCLVVWMFVICFIWVISWGCLMFICLCLLV